MRRRGLVLGVLGAAWATGQLVFLPLIASTIEHNGWRAASGAIAIACAVLVPLVWWVIADRPADVGLRPYGAVGDLTDAEQQHNATHSGWTAARTALAALVDAARTRPFWLLAGTLHLRLDH